MPAKIDLTGQRFGRLTVIERAGTQCGHVLWCCVCDCGNHVLSPSGDLRTGKIKSCGCEKKKRAASMAKMAGKARGDQMRKHGLSGTRLYNVWKAMRERCNNPNDKYYPDYGGRGIRVCPAWDDFEAFFEWAMKSGYDPNAPFGECTIDRIDNDKGYEPSNCRWITLTGQANNRRKRKK